MIFIHHLNSMIENKKYLELGKNAKELSSKFNWSNTIENIKKFLKQLVNLSKTFSALKLFKITYFNCFKIFSFNTNFISCCMFAK